MAEKKKLAASLASSIEKQSDVPYDSVKAETIYVDGELEREIKKQQLIRLMSDNQSFSQDIAERKGYAGKIFMLTIIWSVLIFLILFLNGWHILTLSDTVIVTLIGSTTINFFGFFFLVTKYLFNAPNEKDKLKINLPSE